MQSHVQLQALLSLVSVFWQPVCCTGESRSPLSSLRLVAASSSQSTRSGVRYQETVHVLSICENVFDCVARVRSSAYPNFSDSVGARSHMYTLKNDGVSMDPWGRPFFKIRFRLT